MNWLTTDLHELLASLQQALHAAPANPADPFRTAAFITAAGPQPTARTVVLRRTDPDTRQLFFHTDTRSAKLRELAANPRVTWLFYHPLAAIQIRAEGTAAPLPNDASIRAAWLATPPPNRLHYRTPPPPPSPPATPHPRPPPPPPPTPPPPQLLRHPPPRSLARTPRRQPPRRPPSDRAHPPGNRIRLAKLHHRRHHRHPLRMAPPPTPRSPPRPFHLGKLRLDLPMARPLNIVPPAPEFPVRNSHRFTLPTSPARH